MVLYIMSSNNIETRTRILDAAWKLLETGQGSGVRMSDIAKTAGISRQAVYLHFPTRAELLIATTRHLDVVKDVDARLMATRRFSR
jgi:AcrR family transcriptional regulator